MQQKSWLAIAVLATAAGFSGCADEVEDINRVQPHSIKKSDLEGQWYYRQTVVDYPSEDAFAFSGIECGLEKVRFEVREDVLLAYRVHETIPGLESNDTTEGAPFKGDPVASFPIVEHFDIIRDFNRQTGEQSNVITEDSTLHPWYERTYMRVDWAGGGRTGEGGLIDGPVNCQGIVAYRRGGEDDGFRDYVREAENDKRNPDHLQVTADHIFFTELATIFDGGYGCWYPYGYTGSIYGSPCGPSIGKVRHSLVRIDADDVAQFEPVSHLDSELLENAAETFTDRNGNGRFEDGEPFDDRNGNGRYDAKARIKYATVSVGPNRDQLVDVACTPEVLDALEPEVTDSDCRDLQWHHDGRFGFFRSERTAYDRLVGAGHDANRIHLANHHQIWQRTKTDAGDPIPMKERALRPVVYHLNPNFPEDLKATAVRIGRNWNAAFIEAAMAGTGRDRAALEAQLTAAFDADTENAVWMKGEDGQVFGPEALFQVRDNTCSKAGIAQYLKWYPELQTVVDEATEGAEILPGNLEGVCSSLTWESQHRGLERPFVWQQMGDVRFNFIWWVNADQSAGPLGYGPSGADQETGRIISGNAYVYGAAVDEYARSSADVVRAINGELCDGDADQTDCLVQGRSYLDWLKGGGAATAANVEPVTPEYQRMISARLGTPAMNPGRPFMSEKGLDPAAMRRNMADRMRRPDASDPMKWAAEAPANEGRERMKALMQDPSFRSRMVSEPMLQAVAPLFGWVPGTEIPGAMYDMALRLALDRTSLRSLRQEREAFYHERNVMLREGFDDSVIGQAVALKGMDPEEVYQHLRKEIFEGVMLHEVGHTVGLRHNFKASFDALNYQDDFWQIRERYTPDQWEEQRLPEFRYASIMDYGARFNSDTKGLGKYDFAAIKYVYGGEVEVFEDSVPLPGHLDLQLGYQDYSKIPELLGGDLANLTRRVNRPVGELMAEKHDGVLRNAELLVQNRDRNPGDFWSDRTVPYHYCSDELRGDLWCRTWDEGANHVEAVKSAIQRYWNYFFFTSFRRGRDQASFVDGFFGRQDRLAEYLNYPWKYYRFYDAYPVDLRTDLLQASTLGLNFISEVLGTPENGRHCFYEQLNAYLPAYFFNFDFQSSCQPLNIGLGDGRSTWLDFNDEYLYKVDYLGSYYDKIALLYEMLNTDSSFFRITDETDMRQFTIGLYPAFRTELVDLLRDMMVSSLFYFRQDNAFQRLVANGRLRTQLLVDPRRTGSERNTYPGTPRVFTQIPYNLMWQALALSAIFNTTSHDRQIDFVDYLSISEIGSGDERTLGEGTPVVRFTHPRTGQIFEASRLDDGRSISAELLSLAQNYVNTTWRDAKAAAEAAPPGDTQAAADFQDAEEQLQQFVELMDDFRELKSWVDVGR